VAGQYWLSVRHAGSWSAAAWTVALACFVVLYRLTPEARSLPAAHDRVGSRQMEWTWLALVLAAGTFITVFRLTDIPPGLNHDAAFEGLYAVRILKGLPYTSYAGEAYGRETFTFYLRAASVLLMGPTRLAVTLPSTIAGILILPFFFMWARQMFGARLGLVATLFLGVSGWHLIFSRTGWRSDFQPLFTTIACCFFMRGMLTGRALDFGLSGLGVALTVNTYNGARAFPLLFPLWLAAVMWQSWHWRGFLRQYGRGLLAFGVTFLVALAPLAWFAVNHWEVFQARAYSLGGASTLLQNLHATMLLFNYAGNGDDFFIDTPALEYPAAVFLFFGLLWSLARFRDERIQFILLGFAVNALPGLMSNPNMNRNIGTMPFVYCLVGLGAVFFAVELRRAVAGFGRAAAAAFLVCAGIAATWATFTQYLGPHRREVRGYYPEANVLGDYMRTLVPRYSFWIGGTSAFPRDLLDYLSYTGQANPLQSNYKWTDDPITLLGTHLQPAPGKGLAVVVATQGPGPAVLAHLQRRYAQAETVDLRYPTVNGTLFAKALLVPADVVTAASASELADAAEIEMALQAPAGQLRQPRGLAIASNRDLVVCDFGHNRMQQFGPDLSFVRRWGGSGDAPGRFNQPCGVAIGASGQVFVADTWNGRVQVFSADGKFVREWAAGFFGPRGIAVDRHESVFVADTGNNRILRFSPKGDKEKEWGGKGSAPGELSAPVGIAVDGAGLVYVCDSSNGRLQIFDREGVFITQFRVSGWAGMMYSEPFVALDAQGTIWVTVPAEKEVRGYDRSGKLLRTITPQSHPGAHFNIPMGIAYDAADESLAIADLDGRLVRIPLR